MTPAIAVRDAGIGVGDAADHAVGDAHVFVRSESGADVLPVTRAVTAR